MCPRCGASGGRAHHPLCHTGDVVPLLPTFAPSDWRAHVASFQREWGVEDLPDPAWDDWVYRRGAG